MTGGDCPGITAYPCGDHFHIGHTSHAAGAACKAAHPRPHDTGGQT